MLSENRAGNRTSAYASRINVSAAVAARIFAIVREFMRRSRAELSEGVNGKD